MKPGEYYQRRLSGDQLRRCYELAPPRVRQYLEAEISHVVLRIRGAGSVLELGCGYGRVLERLICPGRWTVGIDTSLESLVLARERLARRGACGVVAMDAGVIGFAAAAFDAVVCVQNGICAFHIPPEKLLKEALRVVRPGGSVLLSSYADAFWPDRLAWFEIQAAEGLVGEIDHAATHRGEIVCKDGFRSGTMGAAGFSELCDRLGTRPALVEVDGSSLFCELKRPC